MILKTSKEVYKVMLFLYVKGYVYSESVFYTLHIEIRDIC